MTHRLLFSLTTLTCGAGLAACSAPTLGDQEGDPLGFSAERETAASATIDPASETPASRTAMEIYGPLVVSEGTFTAQATIKPWSSYWFPFREDFLFAPRDAEPSPLERYDRYTNEVAHQPRSAADYERDHLYDPSGVSWAGRCGAWALASILAPEPARAVDRGGIHYRVADLKALLIATFDEVSGLTQIGARNDGRWDDDYADIDPAELHRVLQAELFQKHRPFVIDSDAGIEVWHQPIYKVTTTVTRDGTDSTLVHVHTLLSGASPHVTDLDYTGTLEQKREYFYDLHGAWSGARFAVTSGEWTDRSRWDHPDYVIPMPDQAPRSSLNTEIDVATVAAILGQAAGIADDGSSAAAAGLSCNAIHTAHPGLPDGKYWIDLDGVGTGTAAFPAYCNMTLDGGGWTTFFASLNGGTNVFNDFESTAVDCPDPESKCLRRLPSSATTSTWIAATCGGYALKFNPGPAGLAYLVDGTQGAWAPNSNVTSLVAGTNATYASAMWTGQGSNRGWLLSNNSGPQTFAGSYSFNPGWDYCNGTPGVGSAIRLMYR